MSIEPSLRSKGYAASVIFGVLRGVGVTFLTYPIEVIKICKQEAAQSQKSYQIAQQLFKEGGLRALYRGFVPQLTKMTIKQTWCWPVMMGLPSYLENSRTVNVRPMTSQLLTGLALAVIDAGLTTPLEKIRIRSITRNLTFHDYMQLKFLKKAWKGTGIQCSKLAVNWSTFLISQRYFRDEYRAVTHRTDLNMEEVFGIGLAVALVVSVVSAPLDFANTLCQSKGMSLRQIVKLDPKRGGKYQLNTIRTLWRGCHLQFAILAVNAIASVYLMEKLAPYFYSKVES